jgi:hypothetical protein
LFFNDVQISLQPIDVSHDGVTGLVLEEGAVEDATVLGEFFFVLFLLLV